MKTHRIKLSSTRTAHTPLGDTKFLGSIHSGATKRPILLSQNIKTQERAQAESRMQQQAALSPQTPRPPPPSKRKGPPRPQPREPTSALKSPQVETFTTPKTPSLDNPHLEPVEREKVTFHLPADISRLTTPRVRTTPHPTPPPRCRPSTPLRGRTTVTPTATPTATPIQPALVPSSPPPPPAETLQGFMENAVEEVEDAGREFFSPELMLAEMAHVERMTGQGKEGGAARVPQRTRLGIPNVVHTLFHLMLCKETSFYRQVKGSCSLVEIENRLTRVLRFDSVCRERLREVLQAIFPTVNVTASDSEVLFDLIDGDGNGDVGVAEIANGMVLLIADDIHALLQRCRNIVSVRPQQSLSLVYLSRYELVLLVNTLLQVYKTDPEYALMEVELVKMLDHFDFNLRGRIQLEAFHQYCNNQVNGKIAVWLVGALDKYAEENSEISRLTLFEKTAGEDDQERTFISRKNDKLVEESRRTRRSLENLKRHGRGVNAFIVPDEVREISEKKSITCEGMRNGEYTPCTILRNDSASNTAAVEWEDGAVSTVPTDNLRKVSSEMFLRAPPKPEVAPDPSVFTEEVTQLLEIQQPSRFRKNKLIPVAPLRDRMVQEDFTKNGNVLLPKIEMHSAASKVQHLSAAARVLGVETQVKAPKRQRKQRDGMTRTEGGGVVSFSAPMFPKLKLAKTR